MPLRFFTDEDVYGAVAPALRKKGYDAASVAEVGRLSLPDESQLVWAASQLRAIITFNVGHFTALHAQWLSDGRHHSGIILSAQRPLGETLRRLLNLADNFGSDGIPDQIHFLSDW